MMGGRRRGNSTRVACRPALLLVAGVWLALALAVVFSAHSSNAAAHAQTPSAPRTIPTCISTVTCTPTPTDTATPTKTPKATDTPSGTATATTTAAATDTATATDTTGGATGGDQGGASGPQPTKVSFAQPTIGAGGGGGPAGSSGGITSSGLLISMLLSCGVTIMGIIIAAIALTKLVRGGYGPFLKAMLPFSKRWMKQKSGDLGAMTERESDDWGAYDYDDSREWSARDDGRSRRQENGYASRGRDGASVSRAAPRSYGSARDRR